MQNYLETVENHYGLPDGTYHGSWFRYDVLLENVQGHSYNVRVTRYQSTPWVPVTLVVERGLIDVHLGHKEQE